MTPTQTLVSIVEAAGRARRGSALAAYALYKKAAKLLDEQAEAVKERANAAYLAYTAENGNAPFSVEGCAIKKYTTAPKYVYPAEIIAEETRLKELQAVLKVRKEAAVASGAATPVQDASKAATIFTVVVG